VISKVKLPPPEFRHAKELMQIYEEEKNEESDHPSINVSIDVFEVL
jgi:hypothetical protein